MSPDLHRVSFQCADLHCQKQVHGLRLWMHPYIPFVLNGNTYCSEKCLRPNLQNLLTLGVMKKSGGDTSRRNTLGLLLLDAQIITLAQLTDTLELKRQGDRRFFGDILVDRGYATKQQITFALSKQAGLPWIDLMEKMVGPAEKMMVPGLVASSFAVFPLNHDHIVNELSLVAAAPLNRAIPDIIHQMNRCKVNCFIATENSIRDLIRLNYEEDSLSMPVGEASLKTMEDLYAFRDRLITQYKSSLCKSLEIASCNTFFWIRFFHQAESLDQFIPIELFLES